MGANGEKVSLGLAMIMKDEANNLPKSLGPLAGLFDEMLVVDTGSADQSVALAESYGARVLSFKWVNDFSQARNFSIEASQSDFIMWFDADNAIEPQAVLALRQYLQKGAEIILWATEVVTPQGDRLWQKRVFPRRPDVYFEGRVHEQLIHPPHFTQTQTEVEIIHWGYADTSGARRKGERNLELLLNAPQTKAGDFYWLYQCGRTLFNLRRLAEADFWLTKAVGAPTNNRPLWGHALILLSQAKGRLGQHEEAEMLLRRLVEEEPGYGCGHYFLGKFLFEKASYDEAAIYLESAIFYGPGDKAWGGDPTALSFRAAFLLSRIWQARGEVQPARQALYLARNLDGKNPEPSFALAEVALSEGLAAEAIAHLETTLKLAPGHRRAINLYQKIQSGEADVNTIQ